MFTEVIVCMHPANERRSYIVTLPLIGWAHTHNDPCVYDSLLTTVEWPGRGHDEITEVVWMSAQTPPAGHQQVAAGRGGQRLKVGNTGAARLTTE